MKTLVNLPRYLQYSLSAVLGHNIFSWTWVSRFQNLIFRLLKIQKNIQRKLLKMLCLFCFKLLSTLSLICTGQTIPTAMNYEYIVLRPDGTTSVRLASVPVRWLDLGQPRLGVDGGQTKKLRHWIGQIRWEKPNQ